MKSPQTVYKSECSRYLCQVVVGHWGNFQAWSIDGSLHWRHDNRIRTSADQQKYRHPMAYAVGGYSAEKEGQKKGSFTLNLLHCDTQKEIVPFRGNTIIESLDIVFRRRLPRQNVPHWIRAGEPR